MLIPACRRAPRLGVAVALALTLLLIACDSERDSATARPPVYIAIGASESIGAGARNPTTEGWVAQLHALMPAETRLVNLGIASLLVQQAVEQVLPVAVDMQPDVITIWLAVNDFGNNVPLDHYLAGLNTLLAALARDTRARIYVGNLPDLTLLPTFRGQPQARLAAAITAWNEAIAETAARHGATLVDLYAGYQELKVHPEYVSRDGLHPSSAGHKRIAEQFWAEIGK